MKQYNKVLNIDFLNNDLPDKCANLIIADPPYYKIKGDFDFIWKTFDDYLKDVEKWAIECKRILADNGTILWYGDAKNIAYAQIIFDKYFNLLNNVVWENTNQAKQSMVNVEGYRSFPPLTERILMYESINSVKSLYKAQDYIKNLIYDNNGNVTKANIYYQNYSGFKGNYRSLFFGKSQYTFYTENQYLGLCKYIKHLGYSGDFEKYDKLRKEYDDSRRTFNNLHKLGDVIRLPNYETRDYEHDTIKPEDLTIKLITTCSRENDLVVVPFAGSGTECAMSAKEKRKFIGYEITEKHANMAQERADKIIKNPTLF